MMDEQTRYEIIKFGLTFILIMAEVWAMQPYHEPVIAALWQRLMQICQRLALMFGRAALNAEHNYYIAIEAGI
jgi:hypothetical protein